MIMIRRIRQNPSKIQGERSTSLDLAHGRLVIMGVFFVLAYMLLALRALDLSVIQAHFFDPESQGSQVAQSEVGASPNDARADIQDRNGVMLATTLKTYSLFVDARLIADPQGTAKALVKIFPDLSFGDTLQKLQTSKSFIWLKRNITPEEQMQVLEIGEPGLMFQEGVQRFYPQGPLGAHLVGYTDIDNRGLAGIERGFDSLLSQDEPLKLTIDIRLQHALQREVKKAIADFNAIGGVGVIMDVSNGEVLAGVSLPDFDPHRLNDAKDDQVFNRLTLGAYELGSVFKIFSTAAFFETRDLPMSTTFDAREPMKKGRFTINDYHAQKRIMTLPEVFMHSSNIGTAMMAEAIGGQALKSFYEDLGLLKPLDFEIREVARPLVPDPWREINTLTASYGHGVTTTPLQLAAGVSSIVNGGFLIKPTLLFDDAPSSENKAQEVRIISEKTSHRMRQLMRLVVTEGTGSKADVKGYNVGGKTGTAEKIVNGRYDTKKKISSFVGVFPMDNPRYVVFIMVDEPKGNKQSFGYATAGWVAAPAVARTIAAMAAILGIPPEKETATPFGEGLKQYISTPKSPPPSREGAGGRVSHATR